MRLAKDRVHHRGRRWAAAGLIALAACTTQARCATPEELADVAAKADYAFFTEDRRALDQLVAGLGSFGESSDPLELYAYALAEFRRLQLAARVHDDRAADAAGSACLATLDKRASAAPRDAEGLALEAACAGYLAELGGLKHLMAGHKRDASLAAARAAAPANPRVLLTHALLAWFGSDASATARAEARTALIRAASAFDAVAAAAPGEPTWGGAEAWLFVGRALQRDGDLVGARSAYERALLIAPDFAAARRRLGSLASRR
jgi:cytochrome c-type biogenesis protein CcmH/NrfG